MSILHYDSQKMRNGKYRKNSAGRNDISFHSTLLYLLCTHLCFDDVWFRTLYKCDYLVAFSLRDSFTILEEMKVPVNGVRLGGGGARSPLWRQIQADVYGYPAEIVEAEEGAAYGAALLAGVGGGVWPTVESACDAVVRVKSRFGPNAVDRDTLAASYEHFRALYPAASDLGDDPIRCVAG